MDSEDYKKLNPAAALRWILRRERAETTPTHFVIEILPRYLGILILLRNLYDIVVVRNEGSNQHRHLVGISRIMELQGPCSLPLPTSLPIPSSGFCYVRERGPGSASYLSTSTSTAAILIFYQQNCMFHN